MKRRHPSTEAKLLLDAYTTAHALGCRLYLPIAQVRGELRKRPELRKATRAELDALLRRAGDLLPDHYVSFAPFSGPMPRSAVLKWRDLLGVSHFAGFLSVRPRS